MIKQFWKSSGAGFILPAVLPVLLLHAAALNARAAYGNGVWMPGIDFFDFASAHEDVPEQQYGNAVAMITYGYPGQGIRSLKRLKKAHPDAPWIDSALYYIGLAHFQAGAYEDAFEALNEYVWSDPGRENTTMAQELQLDIATEIAGKYPVKARPLFDSLGSAAAEKDLAARSRMASASSYFRKNRFAGAMEAYLEFIDNHRSHEEVPDAWFMIAKCQYMIALRVDRGRQYLEEAHSGLRDFLDNFPGHPRVEEAEMLLEQVLEMAAGSASMVADYYAGVKGDISAAINYLEYIRKSYAGTLVAAEAVARIEELEALLEKPASGDYRPLPVHGLRSADIDE